MKLGNRLWAWFESSGARQTGRNRDYQKKTVRTFEKLEIINLLAGLPDPNSLYAFEDAVRNNVVDNYGTFEQRTTDEFKQRVAATETLRQSLSSLADQISSQTVIVQAATKESADLVATLRDLDERLGVIQAEKVLQQTEISNGNQELQQIANRLPQLDTARVLAIRELDQVRNVRASQQILLDRLQGQARSLTEQIAAEDVRRSEAESQLRSISLQIDWLRKSIATLGNQANFQQSEGARLKRFEVTLTNEKVDLERWQDSLRVKEQDLTRSIEVVLPLEIANRAANLRAFSGDSTGSRPNSAAIVATHLSSLFDKLRTRLHAATAERTAIRGELQVIGARLVQIAREREVVATSLRQSEVSIESLETALSDQRKQLVDYDVQYAAWRERATVARLKGRELTGNLDRLHRQASGAKRLVDAQTDQSNSTETTLRQLDEEISQKTDRCKQLVRDIADRQSAIIALAERDTQLTHDRAPIVAYQARMTIQREQAQSKLDALILARNQTDQHFRAASVDQDQARDNNELAHQLAAEARAVDAELDAAELENARLAQSITSLVQAAHDGVEAEMAADDATLMQYSDDVIAAVRAGLELRSDTLPLGSASSSTWSLTNIGGSVSIEFQAPGKKSLTNIDLSGAANRIVAVSGNLSGTSGNFRVAFYRGDVLLASDTLGSDGRFSYANSDGVSSVLIGCSATIMPSIAALTLSADPVSEPLTSSPLTPLNSPFAAEFLEPIFTPNGYNYSLPSKTMARIGARHYSAGDNYNGYRYLHFINNAVYSSLRLHINSGDVKFYNVEYIREDMAVLPLSRDYYSISPDGHTLLLAPFAPRFLLVSSGGNGTASIESREGAMPADVLPPPGAVVETDIWKLYPTGQEGVFDGVNGYVDVASSPFMEGNSVNVFIGVRNSGSAADTVTITAYAGYTGDPAQDQAFRSFTVSLPAGSLRTVRINVTAPSAPVAGARPTITIVTRNAAGAVSLDSKLGNPPRYRNADERHVVDGKLVWTSRQLTEYEQRRVDHALDRAIQVRNSPRYANSPAIKLIANSLAHQAQLASAGVLSSQDPNLKNAARLATTEATLSAAERRAATRDLRIQAAQEAATDPRVRAALKIAREQNNQDLLSPDPEVRKAAAAELAKQSNPPVKKPSAPTAIDQKLTGTQSLSPELAELVSKRVQIALADPEAVAPNSTSGSNLLVRLMERYIGPNIVDTIGNSSNEQLKAIFSNALADLADRSVARDPISRIANWQPADLLAVGLNNVRVVSEAGKLFAGLVGRLQTHATREIATDLLAASVVTQIPYPKLAATLLQRTPTGQANALRQVFTEHGLGHLFSLGWPTAIGVVSAKATVPVGGAKAGDQIRVHVDYVVPQDGMRLERASVWLMNDTGVVAEIPAVRHGEFFVDFDVATALHRSGTSASPQDFRAIVRATFADTSGHTRSSDSPVLTIGTAPTTSSSSARANNGSAPSIGEWGSVLAGVTLSTASVKLEVGTGPGNLLNNFDGGVFLGTGYASGSMEAYIADSLEQVLLGAATQRVTILGTGISAALSFTPIGVAMDVRDLAVVLARGEFSAAWGKDLALSVAGFVPVVGELKLALRNADRAMFVGRTVNASGETVDVVLTATRSLSRTGSYDELRKLLNGTGLQANHLNQDAAFNSIIPSGKGVANAMRGDAIQDVGSEHWKFHKTLEEFWDQFRKGSRFGDQPTCGEYSDALASALRDAGYSPEVVQDLVGQARQQRISFGLNDTSYVPDIPGRLNQVKP